MVNHSILISSWCFFMYNRAGISVLFLVLVLFHTTIRYKMLNHLFFIAHNTSLVPRPRRRGKNSPVPFACACARYPSKTWGSGYNRIFSVIVPSTRQRTTPCHSFELSLRWLNFVPRGPMTTLQGGHRSKSVRRL